MKKVEIIFNWIEKAYRFLPPPLQGEGTGGVIIAKKPKDRFPI